MLLALAAVPAGAQTIVDPETIVPTERVAGLLSSLSDADQAAASVASLFERSGATEGLTAETLPRLLSFRLTEQRVARMATALRMDLDWDGVITRAEMRETFARTVDDPDAFTDGHFPDMDADGDGVVTLSEVRYVSAVTIPEPDTAILADMLDWDLDGDGTVTPSEAESVMRALYPVVTGADK